MREHLISVVHKNIVNISIRRREVSSEHIKKQHGHRTNGGKYDLMYLQSYENHRKISKQFHEMPIKLS